MNHNCDLTKKYEHESLLSGGQKFYIFFSEEFAVAILNFFYVAPYMY